MTNYILASHVLVPPAMEAILSDKENQIDAFLAAGHVCTIMGMEEYYPVVEKYKTPVVITGFEPVDLLQGILRAVRQLEKGEYKLENQYTRYVLREGNRMAKQTMQAIDEADKVLFIVDGRQGVTSHDKIIAEQLRKSGQKILLVVNKTEGMMLAVVTAEFYELGLGEPCAISAMHGDHINDLVEWALQSMRKP